MAISKKLKTRWQAFDTHIDKIRELTCDFTQSPFGKTEAGLLDFRGIFIGIPLERPFTEVIHISNLSFIDVDFSGSHFRGVTFWSDEDKPQAVMKNVIFDESTLENYFGAKGYLAKNCSFQKCKYRYVNFYFQAKNCTFSGFNKSNKVEFWSENLLENCTFEGKNANLNFYDTPLKDCKFVGSFFSLKIAGISGDNFVKLTKTNREKTKKDVKNKMENIDFSEADILLPEFNQFLYLDSVKPSKNNCLVKKTADFYKEVLRLTEEKLGNTHELYKLFEWFCRPHPQTPYAMYHTDDWKDFSPKIKAIYYQILTEATENTNVRIH